MNDTGGGVTAIHDVPGDITRIGFHWMLLFPFCHSKGGLYFFFTRSVSEITGFLCPEFANLRISFTRRIAEVTDFFCPDFFPCPEFANFRIVSSHGESRNNLFYHELSNYRISFTRNVAEITDFFVTRLVLGPTEQREVIVEFL